MKIGWKTCIRVGITLLIVYLCIANENFLINAIGAMVPLLVGCMLAYIINIPMSFYERFIFPNSQGKIAKKVRRPLCMILAILTIILIFVLLFSLIIPELVKCIQKLFEQLPGAAQDLVSFLEKNGIASENLSKEFSKVNWSEMVGSILSSFGNFTTILASIVSSVFSIVISSVLSIIFAFYILLSKDKLKRQLGKLIDCYLSSSFAHRLRYYARVFNESFHNYIVGQCTEAIILGALCTLGMVLLGLPYYTMIGALVGFTALIPIVGAYTGAIVGAFMISTEDPFKSLIFIVFIIVLQQLEGNIIYPKVVGSSVGLPAIWVLLSVTIGGGVAGIPGMLLGVPLAASIYRIIKHDVKKRTAINCQKCEKSDSGGN